MVHLPTHLWWQKKDPEWLLTCSHDGGHSTSSFRFSLLLCGYPRHCPRARENERRSTCYSFLCRQPTSLSDMAGGSRAPADRRLTFVMTDNNDTSCYARIFFSLASDSTGEKHIYHLCALCCKFVSSVIPIRWKSVFETQSSFSSERYQFILRAIWQTDNFFPLWSAVIILFDVNKRYVNRLPYMGQCKINLEFVWVVPIRRT